MSSNYLSQRADPFGTAQLSVQRMNAEWFIPLAAAVHSSLYPDGVSVRLIRDCSPHGLLALTRPILVWNSTTNVLMKNYLPSVHLYSLWKIHLFWKRNGAEHLLTNTSEHFLHSLSTGCRGCHRYRSRAFGISTQSTGSSIYRHWAGGQVALLLQTSRGGVMEQILSPPLKRKDILTIMCCFFGRGSTWRSMVYMARSCWCTWTYRVSNPLQNGDQNPRGTLFSCISATVPNPYLPESQTHLTQMVALLGRCPEL